MKCLDRFNRKMKLNGGSLRDENIYNSKALLKETFADDASFTLNVYLWELGIKSYDSKESIDIRLYGRRYSSAKGVTMKFQTLIDTPLIVGDIIFNSNTKEYYLCTESFNIDNIHWQGRVTLCNWILKWQNENGDILEYPCHDVNSTQYNSGEQSNKHFTIGSSQHMITLPCDENTLKLNTPMRFFLDKNTVNPTCFKVTQNDSTSSNIGEKGLTVITLLECAMNVEKDRPDLGICDYIDINQVINSSGNNAENNFVSKSVIYYDTTTILSGGDTQTFIGKFYDSDGSEITDAVPIWEIVCDFKQYLEVYQFDNQIRIGINNDNFVDEEFRLVLSDTNYDYESSLIIKIDSLL